MGAEPTHHDPCVLRNLPNRYVGAGGDRWRALLCAVSTVDRSVVAKRLTQSDRPRIASKTSRSGIRFDAHSWPATHRGPLKFGSWGVNRTFGFNLASDSSLQADRTIHLYNPLLDPAGGSEWRTVNLYETLRDVARVRVWTEGQPHEALTAIVPVSRVHPARGRFPRFGTLVFIGNYYLPGRWCVCTFPSRIIVVHNTTDTDVLCATVRRLSWRGRRPVEIVHASSMLRDRSPFHGPVETSLINIQHFQPRTRGPHPFTVGRLSRDVPEKHHPGDAAIYRALCSSGARVRLMGAACQQDRLREIVGLEVLPACAEPAPLFLQSLDCFFYRTRDSFLETFGRVVLEAMACGVPVVCSRRGGYAEYVEHGRSGFLFDDNSEALRWIDALRADPVLRGNVAKAARRRALAIVQTGRASVRRFYAGVESADRATPLANPPYS